MKTKKSNKPSGINKDETRQQMKKIITNNPKQTEKEIFSNADSAGFNQNPSEQQNYPGIQKHKPVNK